MYVQEDKQIKLFLDMFFFRSRYMYKVSLMSMFHQGHPSLFFSTGSSNPRTPNAMLKPKEKQKMENSLRGERYRFDHYNSSSHVQSSYLKSNTVRYGPPLIFDRVLLTIHRAGIGE